MVTTLTIQIADKQARVAVEGDLRVSLSSALKIKLGNRILKVLNKRGFVWAQSAVLYVNISGLDGRLEPAGPRHSDFKPLPIRLSYDNLFCEEKAPNIIRDWR